MRVVSYYLTRDITMTVLGTLGFIVISNICYEIVCIDHLVAVRRGYVRLAVVPYFSGGQASSLPDLEQTFRSNYGISLRVLKRPDLNGHASQKLFGHLTGVLTGVTGLDRVVNGEQVSH